MAVDETPVPDPTKLTTDQLDRAEERMRREVESATKLLSAELAGYERHCIEQFESVKTELQLIERQRVEQKADTEKAVQAALSAAKEAVKEQTTAFALATDKSERAMSEQLKQLTATFTTAIGAVTDGFNDLKDRVGKIESLKQGASERRQQQGVTVGHLIAAVGVVAVLFGVLLSAAVAIAG